MKKFDDESFYLTNPIIKYLQLYKKILKFVQTKIIKHDLI